MATRTLLLFGATGLVGGHALAALLARGWRVLAPLRRSPAAPPAGLVPLALGDAGPALEAAVLQALGGEVPAAVAIALGTTRRAAGSDAAFVAVDRDLVLAAAAIGRAAGARQALLVSSVGAGSGAAGLYLRTKGEAEEGVAALGFRRVDVLRPGLLRGARSEHRPAEALGQRLAPWIDPLLLGGLSRYRSIDADVVGRALAGLCGADGDGLRVHHHAALRAAAMAFDAGARGTGG
jgi:uncharacterized protein YbjT (DUF2867 family)